ncbi:M56 family metallopeptidase [Priestia megaterium]|uniref:M56 family metallopeptidase n=2 Tax=Priestia TaxID=2800373 RepID=UPI001E405503|nr:M56 family metallopeptidase [Priestia megaterium]
MYQVGKNIRLPLLFIISMFALYISSCIILHYHPNHNCISWLWECMKMHYIQTIRVLVMIMIAISIGSLAYLCYICIKTNSLICELLKWKTNVCESKIICMFQDKHSVQVQVVKHSLPLAFTYGFIRPRILISTKLVELLQSDELEAVLEHEYYHCMCRDPLKVSIWLSLTRVCSFLPVSLKLFQGYAVKKEVAADAFAIRQVGVRAVASALYKLLENKPNLTFLTTNFKNNSFQDTSLRIEALLEGNYQREHIPVLDWIKSFIYLLLTVLLIGCVSFL